ncbi:hypothetical protein [Thalassotalea atypica]|uniref:hypothetical protein n=1 Tax=Thalassotalea atypica TaxID=2054316 RepID=UPI0025748216|nr:hypothetical protein [Thalassotalea atypica]
MKYSFVLLGVLTTSFGVSGKNITVSILDVEQKKLPNMVVYATPIELDKPLPVNPKKLIVGQKDKKFTPYVAVIQLGLTVDFENNDDITHHIYSVSGGNHFEFKIKSGETITSKQFNHAEEVAMGCNIHDWMSGFVLVVDTPYYTQTNDKGEAHLDLKTPGKYQISIWHPQLDKKMEQEINVSFNDNEKQHWNIQLPSVLQDIPTQENQDDFDFLDEY